MITRILRRNLEVAGAAWRGFRYRRSIGAPTVREGLSLLRRLLWWTKRARARPPLKRWKFQIRTCRACDIYDPVRKTCGDNSGVLAIGNKLYPNGCSCLVGVKSSDPKADCTLAAFGLASKWASFAVSIDGTTAATEAPGHN